MGIFVEVNIRSLCSAVCNLSVIEKGGKENLWHRHILEGPQNISSLLLQILAKKSPALAFVQPPTGRLLLGLAWVCFPVHQHPCQQHSAFIWISQTPDTCSKHWFPCTNQSNGCFYVLLQYLNWGLEVFVLFQLVGSPSHLSMLAWHHCHGLIETICSKRPKS